MSEPFEHAVSNGRRGRHAAPTESRRPDYLADIDYPAAVEHPVNPPANPQQGHNGLDERYGDGQSPMPANGGGAANPYPGYGLPAEWARPPSGLSPASTQPSLTHPDWDDPVPPTPAPAAAGEPDWRAQTVEPSWSQPLDSGWTLSPPEPPQQAPPSPPAASTELVVADHGWPSASPTTGQPPPSHGYQRPEPAGDPAPSPARNRHAEVELAGWRSFGESAAPREAPSTSEPGLPERVSRHGADHTDRADPGRAESGRAEPGHPYRLDVDRPAGDEQRHRLARLAEAVVDLADGCRSLAGDLYSVASSRHGAVGADTARTAAEVARLLDRAAEGADGVRHLLEAARKSLADRPVTTQTGANTAERAAVRHSFEHLVVPESAGRNGSTPHDPRVPPTIPQPREATMPPEFPSTAPSYPPVLPLGLRDGAQAATVARQVEAARRHLLAALTVGHDVNDPAWRQQLLGTVEQVLAAVADVAVLARDALAPSAADTTFPGEARFLCALPWEHVPVASPERSDMPASVNGVATLLAALGYEARATRTEQGALQVEVRGARYAVRVTLQQLRLSGAGEWMAYLDWTDSGGHPRSGAETLGPAELSDDELARRVDDSLRRRVGPQSG